MPRAALLILLVAAATVWAQTDIVDPGEDIPVNGALLEQGSAAAKRKAANKLPAFGGYDCDGKITKVWCEEDEHGLVVDVAFVNSKSGFQRGCRHYERRSSYDKHLFLERDESIVKVQACRGKRYGYTQVVFVTDQDRKLVCGRGSSDYTPPDFAAYADNYYRGVRSLLQAEPAGAVLAGGEPTADAAGGSGGGAGWGWKTRCQTYISPKQPRWFESKDWTKHNKWDHGRAFKYGGKSYYKDHKQFELLQAQAVAAASEMKQAHPTEKAPKAKSGVEWPGYYYDEVLPLSNFEVQCDKHKNMNALYGLCWNRHYKPRPVKLRAKFDIVLDQFDEDGEALHCPSTDAEVGAYKDSLRKFSNNLQEASSGVIKEIHWDAYSESMCKGPHYGANVTVCNPGAFCAGDGYGLDDVVLWLERNAPDEVFDDALLEGTLFSEVAYTLQHQGRGGHGGGEQDAAAARGGGSGSSGSGGGGSSGSSGSGSGSSRGGARGGSGDKQASRRGGGAALAAASRRMGSILSTITGT